ncbi:MAG: hypothetical protein AB1585_09435 [Thermodesulfobacteriota bacterium]
MPDVCFIIDSITKILRLMPPWENILINWTEVCTVTSRKRNYSGFRGLTIDEAP